MTDATGEAGVASPDHSGLSGSVSGKGAAGVLGTDASPGAGSFGVYGRSARGTGVHGISDHKTGVMGQARSPGEAGVAGVDFAPQQGGSGVYGQSRLGTGVHGVSFGGTAVSGLASTSGHSGVSGVDQARSGGHGVYGESRHGTAVHATSFEGTGVHASSEHGTALRVTGRTAFSRSGVARVPAGQRTVTVEVDGLTPASIVLATIQAPQAGVAIEGAQPGPGSFVITLSGEAAGDLPVGWFVIG